MSSWDKTLKIGNHEIDEHHKELFHLDSLLDQAIRTHCPSSLEKIITFLNHYVENHFKEEETLMKSIDYQHFERHKKEHDLFKEKVKKLTQKFNSNFPHTHIIFIIRKLIDDLVYHIKHIDIGISKAIREKK